MNHIIINHLYYHMYCISFILNIFLFLGASCKTCFKKFSTKATLLKHRILHHKDELTRFKYCCRKCPYASNNLASFKRHASIHN